MISLVQFPGLLYASDAAERPIENEAWQIETPASDFSQGLQTLETWQNSIGSTLDDYVDGLDQWLANSEQPIKRKASRFVLYFPATLYEDGASSTDVKFRASIDLARSKNLLKLTLSSFDETSIDSADTKTPGTTVPEIRPVDQNNRVDSEISVSLQRLLFENDQRHLKLNGGLKFQGMQPNPYIRLNYEQKNVFDNQVLGVMTHNAIFEKSRGFVLESRQSFSRPLQNKDLLRSQTTGTWLSKESLYLLNQRFTKFDQISEHRFYAYFIDGNWQLTEQARTFDNFSVGFNWRENLYKKWLFAEVEPKVTWSQTSDFHQAVPSLFMQLEMHFYR